MVGLSEKVSQTELEFLGQENLQNLRLICEAVASLSLAKGLDVHLLLVGGYADPVKRNTPRKDMDFVLRCSDLGTKLKTGENFDMFEGFIREVGESLEWGVTSDPPYFDDYEHCSDGKVILTPLNKGVPVEMLPVREDVMEETFDKYLAKQTGPFIVLL